MAGCPSRGTAQDGSRKLVPGVSGRLRATKQKKATVRLDPSQHGWMTSPETLAVMAALGDARFVGGPRRAKWPYVFCRRSEMGFPAILRDRKENRRRHAD